MRETRNETDEFGGIEVRPQDEHYLLLGTQYGALQLRPLKLLTKVPKWARWLRIPVTYGEHYEIASRHQATRWNRFRWAMFFTWVTLK